MCWMCDRLVEAGTVTADFYLPAAETRATFGKAFII
ncbi:MAG: hypothetical protein JWO45_1101 [Spartobacteria bacterium]|nr:hypothetical protein [Spartobacteria bacterium]